MNTILGTQADAANAERTKDILNQLFPPPRKFDIDLWGQEKIQAENPAQFTMVLRHPAALRLMFSPPIELSLGEAFIYNDFDIQGDFMSAMGLIDDLRRLDLTPAHTAALLRKIGRLPKDAPGRQVWRKPMEAKGDLHSKARDQQVVSFHYDVGNDFYALWLDKRMQYSCGYFPTGKEDLDTAQALKIDHILQKLHLEKGESLLDIGCGWGGLAIAAAQWYGVKVTGVTLSEKQAQFGRDWVRRLGLEGQVEILQRDYRDISDSSFDKAVSVGMFEHVGRDHLPEYFSHVHRLLKPGGLLLNHGIGRMAVPSDLGLLKGFTPERSLLNRGQEYFEKQVLGVTSFSQKYIFPDGELVPVSEANLIAAASGFELRDVENLREHYALTLREWARRLEANKDKAIELVGEVVYRTWRLYLTFCVLGFEQGQTNVNQSLLAKPSGGRVFLPLTRDTVLVPRN